MTNFLIFGDDGIRTLLLAQHLPEQGDQVWLVSRHRPALEQRRGVQFHWINADVSKRGAGAMIAAGFGPQPLDVCIYDGQIQFDSEPDAEMRTQEQLRALHLTTTILCIQKLMPNLRQSQAARILFVGSPAPTLAEPTHTQLGIRSVAQALREIVKRDHIGVTCLYVEDALLMEESIQAEARRDDLLALVRCLMTLSAHSSVHEVDFSAL